MWFGVKFADFLENNPQTMKYQQNMVSVIINYIYMLHILAIRFASPTFNWVNIVKNIKFKRNCPKSTYRIHSNERARICTQGAKSFWLSAYLFHYLLQGSTQKWMILASFRPIPSHIELGIRKLMNRSWVDGLFYGLLLQNMIGGCFQGHGQLLERTWYFENA